MATCATDCRYYNCGICDKYDKIIPVTSNGVKIHPFNDLKKYYISQNDSQFIVDIARQSLDTEQSNGICDYFDLYGVISRKQQKALAYQILHCYDPVSKNDIGHIIS